MKEKGIKLLSALVIYFVLAALIQLTIGWGQDSGWLFVIVWAVLMAVADVFVLQPLKRRAINKMNKGRQSQE